jgi:hypothetical protein
MALQPEPAEPGPEPADSGPEPTELLGDAVIRRAEATDVPALTRTLVRAYMDDPVALWMCPSEGLRARTLAGLYSARLRQMLIHRAIWTNPELSSVAVWLPPN